MTADDVMRLSPVIAVVVIRDPGHAEPLARALAEGGVRAVEVTLRTPAALEAIRRASAVQEAVVGVGTVLTQRDLEAAADAGAQFAVSPGATPALLEAAREAPLPLLPGVASASEVMAGIERGYDRFKLFPAEAVGGRALLKGFAGPFAQARFCPTGGVSLDNAAGYLALPNVACVGGSWVAPEAMMAAGDWDGVRELARAAVERLAA
ncbi:MAG TPA: bifunctional 4-hydroxy-2-oxoglutarate aldolase/2-dehydro-3-deoxy-phosphogluconate aldolase [Caulobacteraceae bacterium]